MNAIWFWLAKEFVGVIMFLLVMIGLILIFVISDKRGERERRKLDKKLKEIENNDK